MSPDQITSARIVLTDEQIAELRRLMADEPCVLALLPADDTDALRAALAFYAAQENWREGVGTGPRRAAPCVADGGKRAREALRPVDERQSSGEERV